MKRILYLLILSGLFLSCKKKVSFSEEEKRLPSITQNGRGIFGCYINGETYKVRRHDPVTYDSETGYLFLESINGRFQFRLFVYEGLFTVGTYSFSNTDEEWISADFSSAFGITEGGMNELKITKLDTDKKIVSGVFGLDLEDSLGNVKEIRDGRFDLEIR